MIKIKFQNLCVAPSGLRRAAMAIQHSLSTNKEVSLYVDIRPNEPYRTLQAFNFAQSANMNLTFATPYSVGRCNMVKGFNAGYIMWETDKAHPEFQKSVSALDLLLVPCQQNLEVFKPYCKDIAVIPVPLQNIPKCSISKKPSTYTFYSIFDWTERKAPLESIRAFLEEFDETEDVIFIVKIKSAAPRSTPIKNIQDIGNELKRSTSRVKFIAEKYREDQMTHLHEKSHCYVSFSHGEGWCYPLLDAIMMGNRAISTAPHGCTDLLAGHPNFSTIQASIGPVRGMEWFPFMDASHNWLIPDVEDGKKQMRKAFEEWKSSPDGYFHTEEASQFNSQLFCDKLSPEAFCKELFKHIPSIN